jgi:hypothetical protein
VNERESLKRTDPKSTVGLHMVSHHRFQRFKQRPQGTVAALGPAINTMSSFFFSKAMDGMDQGMEREENEKSQVRGSRISIDLVIC